MKRWLLWMALALLAVPLTAQDDAFNLPAPLFVLTNEGRVDRYGLGTEGVSTVTPDDEFVVDFGVAPDGNWLAYRTENALKLRNIYSEVTVTVDDTQADVPPIRGNGATIAWSPVGDAVATTTLFGGRVYFNTGNEVDSNSTFTAVNLDAGPFVQVMWSPDGRYLAAEADAKVWWVYRREQNNLILTSAITSSNGLAWFNADTLAFAPADGGLRLMDLSLANTQSVLMDETWVYSLPNLLPDGTLAVFGWQKGDTIPEGYGRLIGLPAGEPRIDNLSELSIELVGLRWMPNSRLLITFRGGALALVNPVTADGFPLPVNNAVAYDWGPEPVPVNNSPLLSAPLFFLADNTNGVVQVWRLAGDGTPAEVLTTEPDGVGSYGVAPSGQQIAYSSGNRLLVQRLNGSPAAVVADLVSDTASHPTFSVDGQRVTYSDNGIWVVPTAGGDPRQIVADDLTEGFERRYSRPVFAPNLDALLVQVARSDITVPGVLDPNTGEVLEIAVEQQATWLDDGRILLYGAGMDERPGGLAIAGVASLTQPAQFLPDIVPVQAAQEISTNQLRLILPSRNIGPDVLRVASLDVTTGQLASVQNGGFLVNPTLSPDGLFAVGFGYQIGKGETTSGPLILRNLETGEQFRIGEPPAVWDVSW